MSVAQFGAPKSFHDRVARVSSQPRGRIERHRSPSNRASAVVVLTFIGSALATFASLGMPMP